MRTAIGSTILGMCVLGASACSRHGLSTPPNVAARPVSLGDFARSTPQDTIVSADGTAPAADDIDEPIVWFDDFEERTVLHPAKPGDTVIVDSLVGHVNGRPVFADEFLKPIEDHLLRVSEQTSGIEREQVMLTIINDWLQEVVLNELILAEAEASLSEQEQMGLFAMLDRAYDEEIRKGGGTRSGAETRRRREGDELEQYLGKQKDIVLIDRIRQSKIEPKVVVTWRDIEREYQRHYEQFNPAATVTLARIRLNTRTQAQLIADVTRRLEAGESFEQLAEELDYEDGGVWETFEMGPGGITDIEVNPVMKQALDGLAEGDSSPPFELGSGTLWLYVVSVDRPPSRSIYHPAIQLGLRRAIRARRGQEEWQRYIESLLEKGIHDDLDAMAARLFRIAMVRYAR